MEIDDPAKQSTLTFLTNQLTFAAATVAAIYKDRWQVELFFKALKQNLKIKTFVGTSANALQIQVWTALIAILNERVAQLRPNVRHQIHYAARDREEGDRVRYRVIDPRVEGARHEDALMHFEAVPVRPSTWPPQIQRRRRDGVIFTDGSAAGYIRQAWIPPHRRKSVRVEVAWP